MTTSAQLVALFLPVFLSTTSLSLARPSFDASGRHHALPYWRDSGVYDYTTRGKQPLPGVTSPYYVDPSSRDLDIDFTIGGDEKPHSSDGPIRSGYVAREEYRDRYPEDINVGVFADAPAARYDHALSGAAAEGGWSRPFYPSGDDLDRYPAVITQPLDHKVGEIKLRSDQGYQLSMHVPPTSVGDRPGVLKIDMKATLYKPIYY